MEGKNKEFSTQDSFGAYLKTAVRNTKINISKGMSEFRNGRSRLRIPPIWKQSPAWETIISI